MCIRDSVYTEHFGKAAYITKCTTHLMRDYGAIPAPQNSFLLNLGMETLHLRMKQHCSNALKVAQFLENNDNVSWVNYPGLASSKDYELAKKLMPNGDVYKRQPISRALRTIMIIAVH